MSSRRAWKSSRIAKNSSARFAIDVVRHVVNASAALRTAASTSSTDARSTAPLCTPAAGLNTGPVRPDVPSTRLPPIQWGNPRDRPVALDRGGLGKLRHRSILLESVSWEGIAAAASSRPAPRQTSTSPVSQSLGVAGVEALRNHSERSADEPCVHCSRLRAPSRSSPTAAAAPSPSRRRPSRAGRGRRSTGPRPRRSSPPGARAARGRGSRSRVVLLLAADISLDPEHGLHVVADLVRDHVRRRSRRARRSAARAPGRRRGRGTPCCPPGSRTGRSPTTPAPQPV